VLLLDTHAAIWFATEDESMGRRSRALADEALKEGQLGVSAISFWEIALLVSKGRLQAVTPPAELRTLLLDSGVVELAVTGDIALLSVALDLHGDPADRFIAATAIAHRATLASADERLLKWKHPVKRQDARK